MNLTPELKDQYQLLINKGYTSKQIAIECKTSTSTIKRNLILLGLKTLYKKDPVNIPINLLKELIDKNKSIREIANEFKCGDTSIKTALKKHRLKTHAKFTIDRKQTAQEIQSGYKTCSKCKQKKELTNTNFYFKKNGKFHYWCKSCNDIITRNKQKEIKQKAVNYKGGKCSFCGYKTYIGALDFHHIDPANKSFTISSLRTYSWDKIKIELDKCICLCKNCHAEIHDQSRDYLKIG